MDHLDRQDQLLLMKAGSTVKPKYEKKSPDWSRFGLNADRQSADMSTTAYKYQTIDSSQSNELFQQDSSAQSKPWWSTNFFVSEPVLFKTWDGVFTSCLINIFGVIIFLRTGWMVGNAGIGFSMLIIMLTISVALVAALSAIGVCERCKMESGGVYFLLSHVLGARLGASIGILYCFGQAVSCSLYTVGFGESISALFNISDPWIARAVAIGVVILLLGINVAGVKWVIRLQLVLLFILFIAVLDFLVGSFVHTNDSPNGFVGYSFEVLRNNTGPSYLEGESFFTVFGVFFPTATGVFAGINMCGDLQNPRRSIPVGTLSAVGVSTLLYLLFAVVLGATCLRKQLQNDYMIAEKVSFLGALFLIGLYISSISSCMGALYGSPRILQSIASENVIPKVAILGKGRGPNKVPVFALLTITGISLIFILIGKVNTLAPIVTMPFMMTYAAVDYTYFALAMSFDDAVVFQSSPSEQTPLAAKGKTHDSNGLMAAKRNDLDYLFPERQDGKKNLLQHTALLSDDKSDASQEEVDTTSLIRKKDRKSYKASVQVQPKSFYSAFCNRWLSLFGSVFSVVVMFGIQWVYALANFVILVLLYAYIGQANPGVFPGIADFSFYSWIRESLSRLFWKDTIPEQMIVNPYVPNMDTTAAQLTEDNEDFADRGRYHHSETFQTDQFDDMDSD